MRKLVIVAGAALVLVVVAVVAGLIFWLSRSDDVDLVTEAPAISSTPGQAAPTAAAATDGTPHFVVVPGRGPPRQLHQAESSPDRHLPLCRVRDRRGSWFPHRLHGGARGRAHPYRAHDHPRD